MRDYISRLIWKRTQGFSHRAFTKLALPAPPLDPLASSASLAANSARARAETDMAYHSAGSPFEFEEARLNSRPLCSDGEAVLRQPFGVSEGH